MEARMLLQAFIHCRVFVRGVVVCDQAQHLVLVRVAINVAKQLQPLSVVVALLALRDYLAVEHVERRRLSVIS